LEGLQKQKNIILKSKKRIHFTLKTGSTTTGSTSNDDEGTSGSAQTFNEVVVGVTIAVAIIGLVLLFYYGGWDTVKAFIELMKNEKTEEEAEEGEKIARGGMSEEEAKALLADYDYDGRNLNPLSRFQTVEFNES
jgi:hypothetical protein